MKSPSEIAARLAKQWQQAFWRVERLLSSESWPLVIPIGKPSGRQFADQTGLVQAHVQRWRQITVGEVVFQDINFRAAAEPVSLPCSGCCTRRLNGPPLRRMATCSRSLRCWKLW